MKSMTKKVGLSVTAAAALLIAGCASDESVAEATVSESDMGQCHGVNSCKGTSACATAESSCSGQNACKGKGWLTTSKGDCDSQNGTFKQ